MENKKNVTNEKITWNDFETALATEIVRKQRERLRSGSVHGF